MDHQEIEAFGHRVMRAMTERDFVALGELLHPDLHFRSLLTGMDGEFFGHDGMRVYFERLTESFDEFRWEFQDVVAAEGDTAVVRGWFRARGRESGIEFERLIPQVWRFREGRGIGNDAHTTLDQALAAAGLTAG